MLLAMVFTGEEQVRIIAFSFRHLPLTCLNHLGFKGTPLPLQIEGMTALKNDSQIRIHTMNNSTSLDGMVQIPSLTLPLADPLSSDWMCAGATLPYTYYLKMFNISCRA